MDGMTINHIVSIDHMAHISSIVGNAHSKPDGNGGGSGRKHFFSNNII